MGTPVTRPLESSLYAGVSYARTPHLLGGHPYQSRYGSENKTSIVGGRSVTVSGPMVRLWMQTKDTIQTDGVEIPSREWVRVKHNERTPGRENNSNARKTIVRILRLSSISWPCQA